MTDDTLKRQLASGGVALGAMLFEFATLGTPRALAAAGASFAIYDQEHTGWSIETLKPVLAATAACGVVPLVRVAAAEPHLIGAALDAGALGLMIPHVDDAAAARRAVAAAKYPPEGERSFGIVHSQELGEGLDELMATANREQLLIALIESSEGVRNADEIAAVAGVDVLWIGPNDLAASLGCAGHFDDPLFAGAVDAVLEGSRGRGKAAGMSAAGVAPGRALLERGFRMLAYRDVSVFERALRDSLDALR